MDNKTTYLIFKGDKLITARFGKDEAFKYMNEQPKPKMLWSDVITIFEAKEIANNKPIKKDG